MVEAWLLARTEYFNFQLLLVQLLLTMVYGHLQMIWKSLQITLQNHTKLHLTQKQQNHLMLQTSQFQQQKRQFTMLKHLVKTACGQLHHLLVTTSMVGQRMICIVLFLWNNTKTSLQMLKLTQNTSSNVVKAIRLLIMFMS